MYNSRASWILLGFRVSFNFSNNISAPFSPANSVVEINWAILSADPDKPSTNLKPSGPSFFCSSSGRSASRVPRALTRQQYSASFCASPPNRGKPPPFDSVLVTASSAWMKFAYLKVSSSAMVRHCQGASSATSQVGPKGPGAFGSSATSVETTPTLAAAGLHLLLADAWATVRGRLIIGKSVHVNEKETAVSLFHVSMVCVSRFHASAVSTNETLCSHVSWMAFTLFFFCFHHKHHNLGGLTTVLFVKPAFLLNETPSCCWFDREGRLFNGKTPLFDDQTHCPLFDVLTQMVLILFVDEPPFFQCWVVSPIQLRFFMITLLQTKIDVENQCIGKSSKKWTMFHIYVSLPLLFVTLNITKPH